MKKQLNPACTIVVTCVFLLSTLVSCTVDENYDLSKGVDATIGVGKGLSFPIGSSKKIELSEFLKTEDIEFLKTDEAGNYAFSSTGSFSSGNFRLEETELNFDLGEYREVIDMELTPADDGGSPLFPGKFPYLINRKIEHHVDLNLEQDNLPKEVKRVRKITFAEPVELMLFLIFAARMTIPMVCWRRLENSCLMALG